MGRIFGTIKGRLGMAFAAVLLLMILMLGFGLMQQARLSHAVHHLTNELAGTERDARLWKGLLETEAFAASLLTGTGDPDKQKPLRNQIEQAAARIAELVKRYAASSQAEADQALLTQINALHARQLAAMKDVFAAVESGSSDYARSEFTDKLVPASIAYQDALGQWADRQQQRMDAGIAAAESERAQAQTVMLALGLIACSVGAALAWHMSRSIGSVLGEAVRVANAVAEGQLGARTSMRTYGEMAQLLDALGRMSAGLDRTVSQIREASDNIQTASHEIAAGNDDLSRRTMEQAATLSRTTEVITGVSNTVRQSVAAARQASELASEASDRSEQRSAQVTQLIGTMDELTRSSQKIAEIVGVIDALAFQTNILALNAAVEAARAGESGRGFAVVAAEVRNLAQRSAAASKEIRELINNNVTKVDAGAKLVVTSGESVTDLLDSIKAVASLIDGVASTTVQQSDMLEQINRAVNDLDDVTQQNVAMVEECSAATLSLADQSTRLNTAVAVFKTT